MKSYYINKALIWMPLTFIGILNGALRTFILSRFLTDFHSRQISSLLMIVLTFLYSDFVYDRLHLKKPIDAWATGLIWLFLTVTFEFTLGYFVLGSPLESMLADYNLVEGHLWPLVLLGILIIPWLHYKLGGKKASTTN